MIQIREFAADPMAFIVGLIIPSAHGPQRFADCMADFQRERFAALAPALLAVARLRRIARELSRMGSEKT